MRPWHTELLLTAAGLVVGATLFHYLKRDVLNEGPVTDEFGGLESRWRPVTLYYADGRRRRVKVRPRTR